MKSQLSPMKKQKDIEETTTIKKNNHYRIYIEDVDGTVYSTKLSRYVETVDDAIKQALKNFNNNLGASLSLNTSYY